MNGDRIIGSWKQLNGNVKQQWGRLIGDPFIVMAGRRDHLAGKIQESYGCSKDSEDKQLASWRQQQKAVGHFK